MKSIFKRDLHIDPYYAKLDRYVDIMYLGAWTPAKYLQAIRKVDIPYYHNQMIQLDKEVVKRCVIAVSLVEDKIKLMWPLVAIDFPQTIIGDVTGLFAQSEVTHRRSYSALAEYLGIHNEDIVKYPALKGRIEYLNRYLVEDPKVIGKKRVLKKLVLFTALVERCSLFTQFYILMSYNQHNKGLKAISTLQGVTALEEFIHYSFGKDLIDIVKTQHPQLWDEYMIDLIEDNINVAYNSELNLIDWFFENGVPSHITREEVVNFLNYNFNKVSSDLGLGLNWDVNDEILQKNMWFIETVFLKGESDFFDMPEGGYMAQDEDIDLDELNF